MALTVSHSSKDSLITSQEIIDNTPVGKSSYPDMRTPFIIAKEERLFRTCFGWDFYLDLMNNKVVYKLDGSGDEQYVNFREATNYDVGDFVLHEGRLYECTKVTTGTQRPSMEVQNEYFVLAPKFATDEYNFIWERYLKTIIAFSITAGSVFYRAIQDTAKGLLKKFDENSETATMRELGALKGEYIGDISDIIANMEEFIIENRELTVFENYKAIAEPCEDECRTSRRHYGFNTN